MTPDERHEYFRIKQREYANRKAALMGRTRQIRDMNSHPTKMSPEERRAYDRECAKRHKELERLKLKQYGPEQRLRAQRY